MKFALSAIASATLSGLVASRPSDITERQQALQAEYDALQPQLKELGLGSLNQAQALGINIPAFNNFNNIPFFGGSNGLDIDLAAMRAAGYVGLADQLERVGNLGLDAGEKGLVALKKVIASGLQDTAGLAEAQVTGQEAVELGEKAAQAARTDLINELKASGFGLVAASLETNNGNAFNIFGGQNGNAFNIGRLSQFSVPAPAPSYTYSRVPVHYSGYRRYRRSDITERQLALQAEYDALQPQLKELGLDSLNQAQALGINIPAFNNFNNNPFFGGSNGFDIDLAAMRAAGYAGLADQLERVGNMGLAAGEKGLVALKKVIASGLQDTAGLVEAQVTGQEAVELGEKAAQAARTDLINELKASGFGLVAASLEANNGNAFNIFGGQNGNGFNIGGLSQFRVPAPAPSYTYSRVPVQYSGYRRYRRSDITERQQALQAEYDALEPQLKELGIGSLKNLGMDFSTFNFNNIPFFGGSNGLDIDLPAMRAAGYVGLADQLERVGNMGLAAGEKGLVALKKVIASGLQDTAGLAEAQVTGQEAVELGQQAAEAARTDLINELKASGFGLVAASLETNNGNAFNIFGGQNGNAFNIGGLSQFSVPASVPSYTYSRVPVQYSGYRPVQAYSLSDITERQQALQAEYDALEPQLKELGIGSLKNLGIDFSTFNNFNNIPFFGGSKGLDIDLTAMRAAGYGSLADQLERVGNMGLAAGEKGLAALKKLVAAGYSNPTMLAEAQATGEEAVELGQEAANAARTDLMRELRAGGFDFIANSLEANNGNAFNIFGGQNGNGFNFFGGLSQRTVPAPAQIAPKRPTTVYSTRYTPSSYY